jgi:hypothetical protein
MRTSAFNKLRLLAAALLGTGVMTSCAPPSSEGLAAWTKEVLRPYLQGQEIALTPTKSGDTVNLPAVISTGPTKENACVTIQFERSLFDDRFIKALFFSGDGANVEQLLPFAGRGVEAVLTQDAVLLNVYPSVVLHLRSDIIYPGGYRAFKSSKINGRITWVKGTVGLTKGIPQTKVLDKFVYAPVSDAVTASGGEAIKQADGSYTLNVPLDKNALNLPKRFPPKRVDSGSASAVRCSS